MTSIKSSILLVILAIIFATACKKTPSTNNNNNNTAPVAASGTVIINGKIYPIVSINCYGKYNEKSYNLDIDLSNTDSAIHLLISSEKYLPTSATIPLANNIMPLASGQVSWILALTNKTTFSYYQESSLAGQSGDLIITNNNNAMQFVANNSQGFKMNATAGSKISFNIKRNNPTIPSSNATFTAPIGMDPNNIVVGSTSWNHIADQSRHTIAQDNGKCKASVQFTGSNTKEIDFYFIDGLPVSGTYDIVTSEAAVAPGKVFVKYTSLSPIAVLTSTNTSQKIIVENVNGLVKIYAKNIDMGTEILNAFITY